MSAKLTREREVSYGLVIQLLDEHFGQLHAVASCLVDRLKPGNPDDPEEGAMLAEWRLAQVIEDMLGSAATIKGIKGILMGGSSDASH